MTQDERGGDSALLGRREEESLLRGLRVDARDGDRPWIDAWAMGVDSPLELRFLQALEARGLAVVRQHAIRLRPGEAPVTVADFALPDRRVAIYVDSAAFHIGAQLRRDKTIRDRLREANDPWRVETLTIADLRAGLPTLADLSPS